MKKHLPKKILAFGLVASIAPAIGLAKPKDKDENNGKGKSPASNVEKQARKAKRKAKREVVQTAPQAAQVTETIERSKAKPEAKKVQREMPQQSVAPQIENNAAEARAAAAAEQQRAKSMQQQLTDRPEGQQVAEKAREQKQRAEAAPTNARERAEAVKNRAEKGPKPEMANRGAERAEAAQTNASETAEVMKDRAEKESKPEMANRGAERAEAAQANARERAEAMKEAATDPASQVTEKAERKSEQVAEGAKGRGEAMRQEAGERGSANMADAKERLERAKNRANMSDQPTEPTKDAAEKDKDRAEKMKESDVAKADDKEKSRERDMKRDRPEDAEAAGKQKAAREEQMAQASQQEVADTETESTLKKADTAEKANVTPEVQAERRQKARQGRTQQTAEVLRDQRRRPNIDQRNDFQRRARDLDNDDDALKLIAAALGGFAVGAVTSDLLDNRDDQYRYGRLPLSQVGRTQYERDASVGFLTRRFQGRASYDDAPRWFNSPYQDGRGPGSYHPHFYNDNVRVVRYSSYDAVPPVLLGYNRLNRVNVETWADTPYYTAEQPTYYQQLPEAYNSEQAVAVSYPVDPDSAVTEDDILFDQGSTNLADAYSYDLIVDMAEAINSSELQNERFVVEGHASAEGDYGSNQQLSQDRAERIAADLVDLGVAADRIIPVGYGESEAQYPADAPESQRELDRRVMVFRLED